MPQVLADKHTSNYNFIDNGFAIQKRQPVQKAPVRVQTKRVNPISRSSGNDVTSVVPIRAHSQPKKKTQTLKMNLMADYGLDIHHHLKKLELRTKQTSFLNKH